MPIDDKKLARPLSFADKVSAVWFSLDAFTHLTIEALYLYFAFTGGANDSKSPLAFVWREYGRADSRWATPLDPEVVSVELPTVLLMGPGALLCLYAILNRKAWRNLAVAVVCIIEIIGGWYTFAPDWVRVYAGGATSLSTADPWLFWVLLVFMNGLWVLVPGILLYDACVRIVDACDKAKTEGSDAVPSGAGAYWLIAASLVAYSVLIPVALINAKAV